MSQAPDLTGKVTVPVFHLFDRVAQKYLVEVADGFVWTTLDYSTSYWTLTAADEAAVRAGGDVTVTKLVAYVDPE